MKNRIYGTIGVIMVVVVIVHSFIVFLTYDVFKHVPMNQKYKDGWPILMELVIAFVLIEISTHEKIRK